MPKIARYTRAENDKIDSQSHERVNRQGARRHFQDRLSWRSHHDTTAANITFAWVAFQLESLTAHFVSHSAITTVVSSCTRSVFEVATAWEAFSREASAAYLICDTAITFRFCALVGRNSCIQTTIALCRRHHNEACQCKFGH